MGIELDNSQTRNRPEDLNGRINLAMEWRPIETAPKTGEPILVHNDNWGTCIGRWTERKTIHSFWEYDGYEGFEIDFTHWMPLPKPPVMKNKGK